MGVGGTAKKSPTGGLRPHRPESLSDFTQIEAKIRLGEDGFRRFCRAMAVAQEGGGGYWRVRRSETLQH